MIAERLRKSILQAAIQGKLTEQLPEDGDARDLLTQIKAEKEQLIKDGKIKREKAFSDITEDEIPFDIPENWCWVRLGEVYDVRDGTHDTPAYISKGYPLITGKDFYSGELTLEKTKYISETDYLNIIQRSKVDVGDILFSMIGGNIGSKVLITEQNYFPMAIKNVALFKNFSSVLNSSYLYWFLGFETDNMKIIANGGAQSFVSLKILRNYLMPLPPVAEQKRIVEKINEVLFSINILFCDEKNLGILQKSFPKKMKDSLLQSAIQGKLTDQLESDGDVRDLVAGIQKEKERLIKEKKIKKENDLPEITEDEIPFDIPDNWCWVRLGTITYNHGQKRPNQEFTYIDISSINNEKNTLGSLDNVLQPKEAPSRARKIVHKGDVIYATVRPYLHNICVVDKEIEPEPIVSTGFAVVCTPMPILNKYLFRYFLSPAFDSYANDNDNSKGVAYPAINDDKFSKALIPLPPLAEQHRIVERLDQLLPLCDALE